MAKRKLEVCVSNLDIGSQDVWNRVQEHFPDVVLRRWGCMGYCHRCVHVPYVLIDDSIYIEADTVEELWEKVRLEFTEAD